MRAERVAALAVVALMLASMLVVPFIGTVSAAHSDGKAGPFDNCEILSADELPGGTKIVGSLLISVNGMLSGHKPYKTDTCGSTPEINGSSADEVHGGIYSASGTVSSYNDDISDASEIVESRGKNPIWRDAQRIIAENHEEGNAKSVAKQEATDFVNDEYSRLQLSTLDSMNISTIYLRDRAVEIQNTDNLSRFDVFWAKPYGEEAKPQNGTLSDNSLELINSSTGYYQTLDVGIDGLSSSPALYQDGIYIQARPNDNELSRTKIVDGGEWWDRVNSHLPNNASDLRSNVENFTEDIYANYETGEINASQFLTAGDLVQQYGIGNQNGIGRALATAGLLGYNTSAGKPQTTTLNGSGKTIEGGLFADGNPPNGTWVTGESYNASNISGDVYGVDSGGEMIELSGEFTVDEQLDSDGNPINSTEPRQYAQVDTDASDLTPEGIQALRNATDNRLKYENNSGGLFGGFRSGPLPIKSLPGSAGQQAAAGAVGGLAGIWAVARRIASGGGI